MANVIILAVLVVIAVYAVSASRKHFRGEGGCCGGAGTVREKKKLNAPRIGEKTATTAATAWSGRSTGWTA